MATLAPVLAQGRRDINSAWPARTTQQRGHDSDGWIGDKNHRPPSDHLPDGNGVVHAIDIDIDMVNAAALLAAILQHPSTRYAIFKDRIYHRRVGFAAAKYTGKYHGHIHWSIEHTNAARNSGVRLSIAAGGTPVSPSPTGGGMTRFATLRYNPSTVSSAVKTYQRATVALGSGLTVDGRFGARSRTWTQTFQRSCGLVADGVVGPKTWTALAQALLNRHGAGLSVDGKWGPRTSAATVAFQRSRGLTADGVFGPRTLAAASG